MEPYRNIVIHIVSKLFALELAGKKIMGINKNRCDCKHCTTHELYRWASIMECGCGCHTSEDICGHDSLCCPYPNGKKKDNPHKDLDTAKSYKIILEEWEAESYK